MTNADIFLLCRGDTLIAELKVVVAKRFFVIHDVTVINKKEFNSCMSGSFADYDEQKEYPLCELADLWISKRIPPANAETREKIREYYWCEPNTYVTGQEAAEMSFCNHLAMDKDPYRVVPANLQFFGNDDAPDFLRGAIAAPVLSVTNAYLSWKDSNGD